MSWHCAGLAGTGLPENRDQMRQFLAQRFPTAIVDVRMDIELPLAAMPPGPQSFWSSAQALRDRQRRHGLNQARAALVLQSATRQRIRHSRSASVAARAGNCSGESDQLTRQIFQHLGVKDWTELDLKSAANADSVYPRVFPVVAAAADAGNALAQSILRSAAEKLAAVSHRLAQSLNLLQEPFPVGKTGGTIGRSRSFDRAIDNALRATLPNAIITPCSPASRSRRLDCPAALPEQGRSRSVSSMNFSDLQTATGEELVRLIHEVPTDMLSPILDNPALDEKYLALLLHRKGLPSEFLTEILKRRQLKKLSGKETPRVSSSYSAHRRAAASPRSLSDGLGAIFDFSRSTARPEAQSGRSGDRKNGTVAARPENHTGPPLAGAHCRLTLADGQPMVVKATLSNPNLTEAQVLRVLAKKSWRPSSRNPSPSMKNGVTSITCASLFFASLPPPSPPFLRFSRSSPFRICVNSRLPASCRKIFAITCRRKFADACKSRSCHRTVFRKIPALTAGNSTRC